MKPIRLVVSAFGPYAGQQVFDFRELKDRALFLITGPTGSGKTAILDAMCFALYGETSGMDRDAAQMRSHHSDPSVATEVTFDFALGDQAYRICRKPQQLRPRKRGEGFKDDAAQAHLWKRTGLTDDNDDGEPMATRAADVTKRVEELLGFRSTQFRQVVLLPQGKFSEVLRADSRQRQEILETLFRTEIYRQIEQALKDSRDGLFEQLETLRTGRAKVLELAGVTNEMELADRFTTVRADQARVGDELADHRKAKAAADAALEAGKAANAKLTEVTEAKKALKTLTDEQEKIDAKKRRRDQASKARVLRDVENQRDQRAKEHGAAVKELGNAQKALDDALAKASAADKGLAEQQARQGEVDGLRRERDRLAGLADRVRKLAEAELQLEEARKASAKFANAHTAAKNALTELVEQVEGGRKAMAAAEKLAGQVEGRRLALTQARADFRNLSTLIDTDKEVRRLFGEHEKAAEKAKQAQQELDRAVELLRTTEKALHEGSAGMLAKALLPGESCPVCGSRDHPAPAHADEAMPDPKYLEQQRDRIPGLDQQLKEARDQETTLQKHLAVAQDRALNLRQQLGAKAAATVADLAAVVGWCEGQLAEAEKAGTRCQGLAEVIESLAGQQAAAVGEVERLGAAVQKQDASVESLSATVQERSGEVPPDLREPKALQAAIDAASTAIKLLADGMEAAQAAAKDANEKLAAAKASLETKVHAAEVARQAAEAEANIFAARLSSAGFEDETAYAAAKLVDEQIAVLDQQIERHQNALAAAVERVGRAETAAAGVQQPDLQTLAGAAAGAQGALEAVLGRQRDLAGRETQTAEWIAVLAKDAEKVAELDKQYAIVGHIADIANGNNAQKLTFQRFVLGSLLDDVLVAASQRLKIMSRGRYLLQRQRDTLDLRRAGGLDLEVSDAYTGTSRSANTLSGGETFLAALSLALGLADVVQAYAGGIRLDTIFIDEGFGSLDTDALDDAMRALIDLQQAGRLVGIISHVPELKERIDTRLEITAGKAGSSATFAVG